MFVEVSVGNEVLRTVKGSFEKGAELVNFIDALKKEGYEDGEIWIYFIESGKLMAMQEFLGILGGKS